MTRRRFRPALRKRLVGIRDGHRIFTVDDFAIRNLSEPDEEFDQFATPEEYPDLIPEGEIWVSRRLMRREGEFFVANALARLKAKERGASQDRAYEAGLRAERRLRARATGARYRAGRPDRRVPDKVYVRRYATLPDPEGPIEVWAVDGHWVRTLYKTDYTAGGHGYVYRWCPKDEIWIEAALDRREVPFIVAHEYLELRFMRDDGVEYDRAHEVAAEMEFDLRAPDRREEFSELPRGPLRKRDLPRLTTAEFVEHVRREYLHGVVRRAVGIAADLLTLVRVRKPLP